MTPDQCSLIKGERSTNLAVFFHTSVHTPSPSRFLPFTQPHFTTIHIQTRKNKKKNHEEFPHNIAINYEEGRMSFPLLANLNSRIYLYCKGKVVPHGEFIWARTNLRDRWEHSS
jgi:hypothetical protein